MDDFDKRLKGEQAARVAKETLTQQSRSLNLAKERYIQNSRIANSYDPKHDGVNTSKEVAKEWYYHHKLRANESMEPATDKEIIKGLSALGHSKNDITRGLAKHSLQVARVEQAYGKDAAKTYVHQTWKEAEREVAHNTRLNPDNNYNRFTRFAQECREAQGVEKMSLNEWKDFSAKNRYEEQERTRKALQEKAHEVSRDIARSQER